jgi:hypothetical protein
MKTASIIAAILLAGSLGFAADAEKSDTSSVSHSKNPLTGTHKTVKKSKSKSKDAAGNESSTEVNDTTKVEKNGTMDSSKTTTTESTQKPK